MKKKDIPTYDVTEILDAGERLGLSQEAVMLFALWLVSSEGKTETIRVKAGSFTGTLEVKPKMGEMVDELLKDLNNRAFYEALKYSGAVQAKFLER